MRIRIVVLSGLLTLLCSVGFTQKLTGNTDTFTQEVSNLFTKYNNEAGIAASGQFSQVFSTNFNGAQQDSVVSVFMRMQRKRWKPVPYYTYALEALYYSTANKGMSGPDLDTLIHTIKRAVILYNSSQSKSFFKTIISFAKEDVIYSSSKQRWYVKSGSFKIKFVEEIYEEEVYDDNYGQEEEEVVEEEESDDGGWGDDTSDDDWGSGFDDWDDDSYDDWGTADETEETADVVEEESIDDDGMGGALTEAVFTANDLPTIEGAVIELTNADLLLVTSSDSAMIKGTSGSLMIKKNTFVGQGGTFDWSNVGLSSDVYAELDGYSFKTSAGLIEAEGVTMHYPSKINEPVKGVFQFKSSRFNRTAKAEYPRFISFSSDVTITDLGDNIKYHGGFSLRGKQVYSTSLSEGKAAIVVTHDGEEKFKANSKHFVLGDSIISSKTASIVLYQYAKDDSISHPGVNVKFNKSTEALKIARTKTVFARAPMNDSYHGLDIHVDAIDWILGDSVLHFNMTNARNERPAFFDSKEIFSEMKYLQLKGLYPFHPLQMVLNYYRLTKKDKFYSDDMAVRFKQNPKTVRSAMAAMMRAGYIDYAPSSGYIILKDKAKHTVLSRRGKRDFDVLSIESISPPDHNATLSLASEVLTIKGVERVQLSDSLNVYFEPRNREIKLLKNREMQFDGIVYTSNYIFNGRDFLFDYDEFSIDLVNIDSIKFQVEVRDEETGEVTGTKVLENKLSYSSGKLLIDAPDNKSGKVKHPDFPHFDAEQGASVVFDQKDVLGGVYDTTIKYKIPPFSVDSLSNSGDQNITFDGSFESGGIFPEIDQQLEIMDDYAFGFVHEVPAEGYPVYGGKGQFFGTISLNKLGIRGNGKIVFLNTTIESDDFVFYKDSCRAIGETSFTKRGTNPECEAEVTFPDLKIDQYEMHWVPASDSMYFKNFENPFKVYDGQVDLNGSIVVSHSGLSAKGMAESEGSRTISQNFLFREQKFTGRDSEFEILTETPNKPALRSDLVKVDIDIAEGMAWFSPEHKGYSTNEFPYLEYKSSIDNGVWDIKKRLVTMEMEEGSNLDDSYFYSIRKEQDSLVFNATSAVYYMDSLKLIVSGVPLITIADSRVYPKDSVVSITENAVMETLIDCDIVMDTINEYHHLFDGRMNITNRFFMDGKSYYEYINFDQDTFPILFSDFDYVRDQPDKKTTIYQTVAKGKITEEDTFYVAPRMVFKGEATMYSTRKTLVLDGFIRLDLHGSVGPTNWLQYKTQEGVDEVRIDLKDQMEKSKTPLVTGLHFSNSRKDYYSTFISNKSSVNDHTLFTTQGILFHDEKTDEFAVVDKEKLENEIYEGSTFRYNESEETYRVNGEMYVLNDDDPQRPMHMSMGFAGRGTKNSIDSTLEITGLAILEYEYPSNNLELMGADLSSTANGHGFDKAVDPFNIGDTLLTNIANLAGNKTAEAHEKASRVGYTSLSKTDGLFADGIVLNELNLVWDKNKRAWYSKGQIGVMNCGKEDVNSMMNGYMEIKKGSLGDNVNLYLEVDYETWYFFSYNNGSLFTLSSGDEYNQSVQDKSNMDKNMPRGLYYFTTADDAVKERFIKHFVEEYLDGKAMEALVEAPDPSEFDVDEPDDIEDDLLEDAADDISDEDFESLDDEESDDIEALMADSEEDEVDPEYEGKLKDYNKIIGKGDKAFSKGSYNIAKMNYEEARNLLPDEPLARKKLKETEAAINGEEYIEEDDLEDAADDISDVPDEFAIEEDDVDDFIDEEEDSEDDEMSEDGSDLDDDSDPEYEKNLAQYEKIIGKGDKALNKGNFMMARLNYEEAAALMPDEQLAKTKLEEVKKAEADAAEAENESEEDEVSEAPDEFAVEDEFEDEEVEETGPSEEELKAQADYEGLIKKGDKAFAKGKLEDAKSLYEEAAGKVDDNQKALDKSKEVQTAIDEAKAAEEVVEEETEEFGDDEFGDDDEFEDEEDFEDEDFEEPGVEEEVVEEIVDEGPSKEELAAQKEFDEYVVKGDKALDKGSFTMARMNYQEAQKILPDNATIAEKMSAVDEAEAKAKEEAEKKAQEDAAAQEAADAEEAKQAEEEAKKKAEEEAEAARLAEEAEAERIAAEEAAASAAAEADQAAAKQEEFDGHIAAGDKALGKGDFDGAREEYNAAKVILPDDASIAVKLESVDTAEEEQKAAANAEAAAAAEAEKQGQFDEAIAAGDKLMKKGKLDDALAKFNEAKAILPDNSQAAEKIAEVEKQKLAEEAAASEEDEVVEESSDDEFEEDEFEEDEDFEDDEEEWDGE